MEAAAVGDRHAEVFVGIDWCVVNADFVVKMRARGASTGADITNYIAAMDFFAHSDRETGKMPVAGGDSVAVIQHDCLAVSAKKVGESHNAIGGRNHRLAIVVPMSTPL